MKSLLSLILLFLVLHLSSKDNYVKVRINATYNGETVQLGKSYALPRNTDSVNFEELKFYISNTRFLQQGRMSDKIKRSALLVDTSRLGMELSTKYCQIGTFFQDEIEFVLGVDSLTNASGARGGDLDPVNGMYWAWQTGYIHFKLEGTSNVCPTKNHRFEFHIGGYQSPFNSIRKVKLKTGGGQNIVVNLALDEIFQKIDLAKTYEVMSPNEKAMQIADAIASSFQVVE